jgi:hypothetical protein
MWAWPGVRWAGVPTPSPPLTPGLRPRLRGRLDQIRLNSATQHGTCAVHASQAPQVPHRRCRADIRAGTRQLSTGCRMAWSVAVKFDRSSAPMACARSLALASSSRSQVAARAASAAARVACGRPSVRVRWRPPLSVAIVTQFVTRSLASRS